MEVVMSEGFEYGYGLFETIRFQENEPQTIEKHYNRIKKSSVILDISFNLSLLDFEGYVKRAIIDSGLKHGVVRLQLSKENDDSSVITSTRKNRYSKCMYDQGFHVCISDVKKSSTGLLVSHKSVNYLENLLILRDAKKNDCDEALFINEKGHLTEGAYTNVFLVNNNRVLTPDISCGLLEGTMRAQIIQACNELGLKIEFEKIGINQLLESDEVFLTNALMGIMPVSELSVGNDIIKFNRNRNNENNNITGKLSQTVMVNWIY